MPRGSRLIRVSFRVNIFLASPSLRGKLYGRKPFVMARRVFLSRGATAGFLGFIACGPSRDEDAPASCSEVWALYVLSSSWSAGVGRALWLAALERLRLGGTSSVTLWVLSENERGRRFYTEAGFVPEPASEKEFALGGIKLKEMRVVFHDVV